MDMQQILLQKLEEIQSDITEIKVQTTKTNGRVTGTERRINLIEKVGGWAIVALTGAVFTVLWEFIKLKFR